MQLWTVKQIACDRRWYGIFVSQRYVSESMSALLYHWHSPSLQNSCADSFITNFYTSDKSTAVNFSWTKYIETSLKFSTTFFFIQNLTQLSSFLLFNYTYSGADFFTCTVLRKRWVFLLLILRSDFFYFYSWNRTAHFQNMSLYHG